MAETQTIEYCTKHLTSQGSIVLDSLLENIIYGIGILVFIFLCIFVVVALIIYIHRCWQAVSYLAEQREQRRK